MGRTILCENCKSTFRESILASRNDPDTCPVCGASLSDNSESSKKNLLHSTEKETNEAFMYFYNIVIFEEYPEYSQVNLFCELCKEDTVLELDKFEKHRAGKYVQLKKGVVLKCSGCGREHKPRKIHYKEKSQYADSLLHCPACGATELKEYKSLSRLAKAKNNKKSSDQEKKSYQCQNCGYRF